MAKKAIVFIDGNNWYHNTKKTIDTKEIDFIKLANFIVNNPDLVNNGTGLLPPDGLADRIFRLSNNMVCLELTLRPIPAQAVGRENRDYNIKTQVRPRN